MSLNNLLLGWLFVLGGRGRFSLLVWFLSLSYDLFLYIWYSTFHFYWCFFYIYLYIIPFVHFFVLSVVFGHSDMNAHTFNLLLFCFYDIACKKIKYLKLQNDNSAVILLYFRFPRLLASDVCCTNHCARYTIRSGLLVHDMLCTRFVALEVVIR